MKVFIVLSLVCLLGVSTHSVRTTKTPDLKCKQNVSLSIANCTTSGWDAQSEQVCILDSVVDYMVCKQPKELRPLLGALGNDTSMSLPWENIGCLVTTTLDLAKCIVQGLFKTPFTWDWTAITKCLVSYLPAYLACVPK